MSTSATKQDEPDTEPNPHPKIPPNFTSTDVQEFTDPSDPEYAIFEIIEVELETVLSMVQPPFISAMSKYGTVGVHYQDSDYNPDVHPRVLSIEIDRWSIHRWAEVDDRIRSIVETAYRLKDRRPPPIRYYTGGTVLINLPIRSCSTPHVPKGTT